MTEIVAVYLPIDDAPRGSLPSTIIPGDEMERSLERVRQFLDQGGKVVTQYETTTKQPANRPGVVGLETSRWQVLVIYFPDEIVKAYS